RPAHSGQRYCPECPDCPDLSPCAASAQGNLRGGGAQPLGSNGFTPSETTPTITTRRTVCKGELAHTQITPKGDNHLGVIYHAIRMIIGLELCLCEHAPGHRAPRRGVPGLWRRGSGRY